MPFAMVGGDEPPHHAVRVGLSHPIGTFRLSIYDICVNTFSNPPLFFNTNSIQSSPSTLLGANTSISFDIAQDGSLSAGKIWYS